MNKREIKFRGKRVDNGKWVVGNLLLNRIDHEDKVYIIPYFKSSNNFDYIEVIPESVGQYTGLRDKNNRAIYEGDIMDYGNDRVFYVSYTGCSFVATFNDKVFNSMIPIENFEIIGNIYETIDDKAKELVDKFEFIMPDINDDGTAAVKAAKQCALICVEEIIKVAPLQGFDNIDSEYSFMVEDHPESFEEFWQKVKEKIQSL